MKREILHGYTGAILRGVSALMTEANSLAEKTRNTEVINELQKLGVIVVSIDEDTGMCVVAHHREAKPLTVALAAAIDAAIRVASATTEEKDANVN